MRWLTATVAETIPETPEATTLRLDVADWPGHRAGQHVDVRLTAEDGYQAQRSYSIASAPARERLELTVVRVDDGEVSPYLTTVAEVGDQLELRGPIGGWFVWDGARRRAVLLVAGGSGVVPLMAMLRHHDRTGAQRRCSSSTHSARSPTCSTARSWPHSAAAANAPSITLTRETAAGVGWAAGSGRRRAARGGRLVAGRPAPLLRVRPDPVRRGGRRRARWGSGTSRRA